MNDWSYCPGCGTKLSGDAAEDEHHESEAQTEQITDSAVRIAEIEANKEIKIAQISAGIVEKTTEVEQAAELAHAEGVAEGMSEAIAPPEPAPSEPVVVVNDDTTEEPESIPESEPEHHDEPPKAPARKTGFF